MTEVPYELRGPSLGEVEGIGALTLGGFLREVCARYVRREALVFDDPLRGGDGVRWSYGELEAQARRVAAALLALGIGKGARVATLMANRPEAVAAYFGAAMAGAVVVPLSTFATRGELDVLLRHSAVTVLLAQSTMGKRSFAADLAALVPVSGEPIRDPAHPFLRHVVALGAAADRRGARSWDDFLTLGDAIPPALVDATIDATDPSDLGLVLYSSGTTAAPKGVLHHQRAPTLQFWLLAGLFGRTPHTRLWSALPLFWTAGMNSAMGATLAAGGCWVMQEGFDAAHALRLMERERVTEPYTLPHQAAALAEHPDWAGADLSSLRAVFGKSVFAKHPTVTGDPGWQMPVGWGMSETCAFITAHASNAGRSAMRASTGTLLPGNRLRVVDTGTGAALPPGQQGELVVKGPTLMVGYLGRQREECFAADGWFHTGDLGYVDADGHVHWAGRRTEMIKTGGANVAPAEIEVQLRAFPPVRLARVIAFPDDRLDQIPVLCVELREDSPPDIDAGWLQAFLRERLAAYKVPKRVLFFATGEIPLTASGTKVRDAALLDLALARTSDKSEAPR